MIQNDLFLVVFFLQSNVHIAHRALNYTSAAAAAYVVVA